MDCLGGLPAYYQDNLKDYQGMQKKHMQFAFKSTTTSQDFYVGEILNEVVFVPVAFYVYIYTFNTMKLNPLPYFG